MKPENTKSKGNENSYTKEFFDELCEKIKLTDHNLKPDLSRAVILAAQFYMRHYNGYERQLPPHEVKKELNKAKRHLEKATEGLKTVYMSGNYGEDIMDNLHDIISESCPALQGIQKEIKRKNLFGEIVSPMRSIPLIKSMSDALDRTLKSYKIRKTAPKSIALYHWLMILSAKLEPALERKLEQSCYYKMDKGGDYISKRDISDSELLLFILEPLDPNVTRSQMETALKETRKERHDTPWDDYFPA